MAQHILKSLQRFWRTEYSPQANARQTIKFPCRSEYQQIGFTSKLRERMVFIEFSVGFINDQSVTRIGNSLV